MIQKAHIMLFNLVYPHIADLCRSRPPGQLVIQITDHCNARCPQCAMRVTQSFQRYRLARDEVKRILDAAVARGIGTVSFTGGEPLLRLQDLVDFIQHAGALGIRYIRTGTNGFPFMNPDRPDFLSRVENLAATLSATPVRNFWISIDSAVPSIHESMRGLPGVIRGIEKALPIFHRHGIYPSANLGINRNVAGEETSQVQRSSYRSDGEYLEDFYLTFKKGFHRYYRFATDMGFTMASACYPMSIENGTQELKAVYGATSGERLVQFSPPEKALLYKALMETITRFRSSIRIFSPRSSLYALQRRHNRESKGTYPCRGGIDFFFIDSREGNTYPCGYRGSENLGKFHELTPLKAPAKGGSGCFRCDWECFRDPSELLGPFLQCFSDPAGLLKRALQDGRYFKLWMQDLHYYHACDMFDGRIPPDLDRLGRFNE